MQKNKTFISIGDFWDVYHKIRENGFYYFISKMKLLPIPQGLNQNGTLTFQLLIFG